jgi:hypothetical protein
MLLVHGSKWVFDAYDLGREERERNILHSSSFLSTFCSILSEWGKKKALGTKCITSFHLHKDIDD